MKIAIVAPTEIPARRANTLQVMKMAQALVALGHPIRLAVPTMKPPACSWEELARHYGLQYEFPIDWLPANPALKRYDFSLRAVRWARRWGAECIYTRLPQSAALASLWGIPTILEIHDLPQGKIGPWLLRGFLKGRGARRLVVITRALAKDLHDKLGAPDLPPFTVIAPDGVDLMRYAGLPAPSAARRMLNLDAISGSAIPIERFTTGYTGHLYPGRGSELLVALAQRLPDITFLVVGGEPQDVARLKKQTKIAHLDNVILTGFVPNADLPLYQAACEVLLMPYQRRVAASSGGDISQYLSPMKLFEYLACQRAILSSDLPVLKEVLNPQNAILLSTDDIEAWVNALTSLRADPQLRERLAEQARQDANKYTWEARARMILETL